MPLIHVNLAQVMFAFLQELVCLCQYLLDLELLRVLIFKILIQFSVSDWVVWVPVIIQSC